MKMTATTAFDFADHVVNLQVDSPPINTIKINVDDEGRLEWDSDDGFEVEFGKFFAVCNGKVLTDDSSVRLECKKVGYAKMLEKIGDEKEGHGAISGYAVINYIPPRLCRIESIHATIEEAEAHCKNQSKLHYCAIRQMRKGTVHPTYTGGVPFNQGGYPSWFQGWAEEVEEVAEEEIAEIAEIEEIEDTDEDETEIELEEENDVLEETGQLPPMPDME